MKNFPPVAIAARGQGTIFSERRVPQEQTGLLYTVPLWGAALTIRLSVCVCVCVWITGLSNETNIALCQPFEAETRSKAWGAFLSILLVDSFHETAHAKYQQVS